VQNSRNGARAIFPTACADGDDAARSWLVTAALAPRPVPAISRLIQTPTPARSAPRSRYYYRIFNLSHSDLHATFDYRAPELFLRKLGTLILPAF